MEQFDLLIIGGGPGGYSLGIQAAKRGLKTALFEENKLGGTCLNVGCIPTKYLVDKALALEKVRALSEQEIFRDPGSFSYRRICRGRDEVTARLAGGVQAILDQQGVTVIRGQAVLAPDRAVRCGGKEYQGRYVVIATGSRPSAPPIPGGEYALDSTGLLACGSLPRRLTVIGGGIIGLELACVFGAFGSEVTIVELMPQLLPREQPEAVKLVTSGLNKQGVRILTGTEVQRIGRGTDGLEVLCKKDGQTEALRADQVLLAVGRRPNLTGIDAGALGLTLGARGHIQVDENQRTNLEGVYAVGDVAGGIQLAHAAYAEGETALEHILTGRSPDRPAPVPSCVYTIPCLASVGLTVRQAEQAGAHPVLGSFPYAANGMALAEGAGGTVFAVMDRETRQTLGVTIVGEGASELIALGALAVERKLTLEDWQHMVVAHPSLSEMVREAALDAFGAAVHKLRPSQHT